MQAKELREKYLKFFEKKGHKVIPSAPLIPEHDPTVLFTTAGMHPLVPYLLGEKHPMGPRLCNSQKCIRTGDIDDVGDATHLTFFEMLGNWSLGDYFKKEAIVWSFEFLTKELNIPLEKLAFSVFQGEPKNNIPCDDEAAEIWQSLGVSKERIAYLGRDDNWWGPAGATGPCGPDTEMFVSGAEIWNDVFMQYIKNKKGKYELAKQKNVDTGMGVERTLAILNKKKNVYETQAFKPIIEKLEKISKKKNLSGNISARIIADHIKASVMLINDGIVPSNVERGYVLRRLIRRAIRHAKLLGINENFATLLVDSVLEIYPDYKELEKNRNQIISELDKEENRFRATLESGIKEFEKIARDKKEIHCKEAFLLYQSYGFPIEMTEELAKERKIKIDKKGFEQECKIHQELSKTASAGQFKSGLADNSEATTKLHTAAHLLDEALRIVLKDKDIKQKGSNITPERLRFDFNFPRRLEEKEIKEIENWINDKIKAKIKVERKEMPFKKAVEEGAGHLAQAKYPEVVSVYSIGNVSKEVCTGPHVSNTSELGKFKIIKEESSSSGIRRIKAILE